MGNRKRCGYAENLRVRTRGCGKAKMVGKQQTAGAAKMAPAKMEELSTRARACVGAENTALWATRGVGKRKRHRKSTGATGNSCQNNGKTKKKAKTQENTTKTTEKTRKPTGTTHTKTRKPQNQKKPGRNKLPGQGSASDQKAGGRNRNCCKNQELLRRGMGERRKDG